MAGFGDNATTFMRGGLIAGGLKVEAGCWTQNTDPTAHIPTRLTRIVSFIGIQDGTSCNLTDVPDVSDGYIKCAMSSGAGNGDIVNYVAFGW